MSLMAEAGLNTVMAEAETNNIMAEAGLNTVMGISIVFLSLVFISLLIWAFSIIPAITSKIEAKKAAKKELSEVASKGIESAVETIAAAEENLADDLELVAVITAAIMAAMGDEAPVDGLVVRSIRKRNYR